MNACSLRFEQLGVFGGCSQHGAIDRDVGCCGGVFGGGVDIKRREVCATVYGLVVVVDKCLGSCGSVLVLMSLDEGVAGSGWGLTIAGGSDLSIRIRKRHDDCVRCC